MEGFRRCLVGVCPPLVSHSPHIRTVNTHLCVSLTLPAVDMYAIPMQTTEHRPCRCGVADWRALRLALGLNQRQMARLLGRSDRGLQALEGARHVCPQEVTMLVLRSWLCDPRLKARLRAAGCPEPLEDHGHGYPY